MNYVRGTMIVVDDRTTDKDNNKKSNSKHYLRPKLDVYNKKKL